MAKVSTKFSIPADELKMLDEAALRSFRSRSNLICGLVRQWLAKPWPLIEAASVIRELRQTATARKKIVLRWRDALIRAKRRRWNANRATAELLAELKAEGRKIGRATLFNWRRRYAARGLAGLVDGRSERAMLPIQTKLNGASNAH